MLVEQVLDPDVAVGRVEGEAEHRGADQDEQHEGGQLGGAVQRLVQQLECSSLPARYRHDQRAQRTHGAALGGRGHAQEDGAQHQEDQHQRRDQHEGDLLGQARQQAHAQSRG
jgi:hypothetical protein